MDALTLLKQDHAEVKELFAQFEALGERAVASKERLYRKIQDALELHTSLEEAIFYPALKQRAEDTEERDTVLEAFEEHAVAKNLIEQLRSLDPSEETFVPKITVLMESVRHHIKEEEGPLFKIARQLMEKDELAELGEEMAEAKRQARQNKRSSVTGEVAAPSRRGA
ncbi:MAG: hemerythrin domain-containing protein, partial [Candidatus Eremiobacteraeota bacterium]|nr:hemerythrin domain-containing protein [Candidatus Eremiobacteraeota bacterium]